MADQTFNVDYVRRLRTGDPAAQDHFVSYFEPVVRVWLNKRVRSPQLRQDVSQDTFARIFSFLRSGGEIENPERLPSFVTAVARNTMREKFREDQPSAGQAFDDLTLRDEAPTADHVLIERERRQRIREVLSSLPKRDGELLRRLFLDGTDREAICRELGVDRDYLRVLLHRAVNNFRFSLKRFDLVRH